MGYSAFSHAVFKLHSQCACRPIKLLHHTCDQRTSAGENYNDYNNYNDSSSWKEEKIPRRMCSAGIPRADGLPVLSARKGWIHLGRSSVLRGLGPISSLPCCSAVRHAIEGRL